MGRHCKQTKMQVRFFRILLASGFTDVTQQLYADYRYSEMELADYCRRTRLFVEQVKEWRAISIQAHEKKLTENIRTDRALRDAKNKLRELEKELKRKDKALAEAAALLILREKFNALWDNSEED